MGVQHKHLEVRTRFEARSRIIASWLPILQGIYCDELLSLGGKVQATNEFLRGGDKAAVSAISLGYYFTSQ